MNSAITFSFLKFHVADINAMFNNHVDPPVENFVFIPYLPDPASTSLGLVVYAQTRDPKGNLQYTGMPFPLTPDSSDSFSPSIAVLLPINFISAIDIYKLINCLHVSDFLSVVPSIIPFTNYIHYTVSRSLTIGDGNDQQQTNPSPPATMQ